MFRGYYSQWYFFSLLSLLTQKFKYIKILRMQYATTWLERHWYSKLQSRKAHKKKRKTPFHLQTLLIRNNITTMQFRPPLLKIKAFSTELENKVHSNIRDLTKRAPILHFPKCCTKQAKHITNSEQQLHTYFVQVWITGQYTEVQRLNVKETSNKKQQTFMAM